MAALRGKPVLRVEHRAHGDVHHGLHTGLQMDVAAQRWNKEGGRGAQLIASRQNRWQDVAPMIVAQCGGHGRGVRAHQFNQRSQLRSPMHVAHGTGEGSIRRRGETRQRRQQQHRPHQIRYSSFHRAQTLLCAPTALQMSVGLVLQPAGGSVGRSCHRGGVLRDLASRRPANRGDAPTSAPQCTALACCGSNLQPCSTSLSYYSVLLLRLTAQR